ncbi:TRAP transporter small permease [Marinomonas sp. GJ51-6]|uniref:TRAP transporter small permease subunit n=1 Tax=Marinomonas sp. GJ51-6 TaxID=2992802 RepID=UPI002934C7E1|nr:TRAP transporter small permease [Marinomonas sp. GJ51-6]WOD07650.1 TRAP transporter small permease [Marinomonas sp. GJ51-6]
MKSYSRLCALIFGLTMTVLCIVIAVETLLRKVFNHSLAGVDELSGYAIAIGAPLCFAVAAIEQSHIRINLFYIRLPKTLKIILNVASAILLTVLAVYLTVFTYRTVNETNLFGSIAQTPWMTPLIWPQSIWLISMLVFAGATVFLLFRLGLLLSKRKFDQVLSEYGPDAVEDELATELSDLESRK